MAWWNWGSVSAAFFSAIAAGFSAWVAYQQLTGAREARTAARARGLSLSMEVLKEARATLILAMTAGASPLVNLALKSRAEESYASAADCLRREIPVDAVQHVQTAKNAMTAVKSLIGALPGMFAGSAAALEPNAKEVSRAMAAVETLQRADEVKRRRWLL